MDFSSFLNSVNWLVGENALGRIRGLAGGRDFFGVNASRVLPPSFKEKRKKQKKTPLSPNHLKFLKKKKKSQQVFFFKKNAKKVFENLLKVRKV